MVGVCFQHIWYFYIVFAIRSTLKAVMKVKVLISLNKFKKNLIFTFPAIIFLLFNVHSSYIMTLSP